MQVFSPDPKPWDPQPGEPRRAYAAFRAYCEAGPDRTLDAMAAETGKSYALFQRWCYQWKWVNRAVAWDAEQARLHEAARVDALRAAYARWAEGKVRQIDEAFNLADRISEKIRMIAEWPTERFISTTPDESGRYLIVEPMNVALRDMGSLAKAFVELNRFGLELLGEVKAEPGRKRRFTPEEQAAALRTISEMRALGSGGQEAGS